MATETVKTPGSQTLGDFQTVVQQNEGIFGPLKALGKEGANNTITFEVGSAPTNRAVLETYQGGDPPEKEGHSVICTGDCLVEDKPVQVVANRKA
jgi:hypothetical protein